MRLVQLQDEVQYYVGWYGVCKEDGTPDASNSDAPCQNIDLNTGRYADGTLLQWDNGKGNFRDQLQFVQQVRDDGKDFGLYDMKVIEEIRQFFMFRYGLNTSDAAQAVDQAIREELNTPPPTGPLTNIVNFADLVCGKAYTIVVKPGTGGTGVGSVTCQIDIPEFRYMYVGTADSGLRLTNECCYS